MGTLKPKILESKIIGVNDFIIGKHLRELTDDKSEIEDIKNMMNSIDAVGQLHPCYARIHSSGKYELVAGRMRYAACVLNQKNNKIETKVIEASDLQARLLAINENVQRKNPDVKWQDLQIYETWKMGCASGDFKNIQDFVNEVPLERNKLTEIISAGKVKDNPKNKDNEIVQNATTIELTKTAPLADYPKARDKVLDMSQKGFIEDGAIRDISIAIKTKIKKGANEDSVTEALNIITPSKDINKDKTEDIIIPAVIVHAQKFDEAFETLKDSPKDVKKKLLNKKISIEQAKIANNFDTEKGRNQIIEETKIIEDKKKILEKVCDDDIKMNVETRKKQQDDIKKKGETELRTEFDKALEKKLETESRKDELHDQEFVDKYQRVSSATISAFTYYHPRKLRTEKDKRRILDMIRNLYILYHDVLADMGEIKDITPDNRENTGVIHLKAEDAEFVTIK
jgi:hypothetical protein